MLGTILYAKNIEIKQAPPKSFMGPTFIKLTSFRNN